jgi:hypothetical protein
MITLLQSQGQVFTDADKLTFSIVWGVLSIISANILLHVWKGETEEEGGSGLTLLSYLGAAAFGTLMAPVISTLALLGWLGTITPKDAKRKILSVYNGAKEAAIGHWRIKSKQAPPHFSVGSSSGIAVHPNPPAIHTQLGGPYINDMLNVKARNTSSLSAPPPPGPHPNIRRGIGPNRMTRLSNGSGAPSWYVPPPPIRAKKAAPKG